MGAAQLVILGLALLSIVLSGVAYSRDKPLNWRFDAAIPKGDDSAPHFERVFDYTAPSGQAHAPAIVLEQAGFSLIWFQGSAEAQPDVDIFSVQLEKEGDVWGASEPAPMITRGPLGDAFEPQQLVVTLGNTIENQDQPGGVYATAVSVGGWAMASVADVRMQDGAPVRARKLNLSPLLNRSHLVKSPMVTYADGSHALPAYFEMGPTYAELIRLGRNGRVRDVRRIPSRGVKAIQPMIVPMDAVRAVAFLRDFDASGRLWISRTEDGGQSWSEAAKTDIANPSAPVAALRLTDGRILMAMNDDAKGADRLRLAVSDDAGAGWTPIHTLEDDAGAARYPMLRRLPGGEIVLTYSHGTKRGVRAYLFNDAWVAAQ